MSGSRAGKPAGLLGSLAGRVVRPFGAALAVLGGGAGVVGRPHKITNGITLMHTRDTAHAHAHDPDHPEVGHVVSFRILYGTAAVLLFLTVVTVAVREIDLGELNIAVALLIAAVKATLVALYFMHLRWDKPFNAIAFVGSILFVALFMAFALLDAHAYLYSVDPGLAPGAKAVVESDAPASPLLGP